MIPLPPHHFVRHASLYLTMPYQFFFLWWSFIRCPYPAPNILSLLSRTILSALKKMYKNKRNNRRKQKEKPWVNTQEVILYPINLSRITSIASFCSIKFCRFCLSCCLAQIQVGKKSSRLTCFTNGKKKIQQWISR